MNVLFVSGVAPIVKDMPAARGLFISGLQLPLEGDDYPASDAVGGVRHFGLWPLAGAARSCFGTDDWPKDAPQPQAAIEFEVEDVDVAAAELEQAGHKLVRPPFTEPWGQRVARLLTTEGLLVSLTFTPWMREGALA